MTEEICEHCDMPLIGCVHGPNYSGKHDLLAPVLATGATIEAQYAGVCAHCDTNYPPHTSITHSTEADGWCHTTCTTTEGI